MALSTAVSAEAWPLGPWELFSRTRGPVQVSYIAKFVAEDRERRIDFGALSAPNRGAHAILGGFTRLDPADQQAVCHSWAAALADAGEAPERIRIYRLERRLKLNGGPPAAREELAHECEVGTSR